MTVRILKSDPINGPASDFSDVDNGFFDTSWDPSGLAPAYNIIALEITIRVWDLKTQQARQITIVQDM
jgi:hypothetical protein